jgi:antirestriction protein ArdC
MKAEEARKLTDQALSRLAEALAQGKSDALRQYLAAMANFHNYSFGNLMLIISQKPDASQVAGFNAWKKLGRFVKKGEKGIAIIAPMIMKRDEGRLEGEKDTIVRFKVAHVFDLSQTDGEPLPEMHSLAGDPGQSLDRLKAFASARGISITYEDLAHGVSGLSSGGAIKLRSGLAAAEEFGVLAHELAHELLHHGEGAVRGSRTVRETEAEAVAFVVTHAVGLDTGTAATDYIQLYQGTADTLAKSLDRIQKTANTILEALTDEEPESIAA